jgi:hypothetical protein
MRMAFVDTARSNTGAIKFFKRMGYGKPETEVWMRKMLQRTRKTKNEQESVTATQAPRSVSPPSRITPFPRSYPTAEILAALSRSDSITSSSDT